MLTKVISRIQTQTAQLVYTIAVQWLIDYDVCLLIHRNELSAQSHVQMGDSGPMRIPYITYIYIYMYVCMYVKEGMQSLFTLATATPSESP